MSTDKLYAYVTFAQCNARLHLKDPPSDHDKTALKKALNWALSSSNTLDTFTFLNELGSLTFKARQNLSHYLNAQRLCDGGKSLEVTYNNQVFKLSYDIDHTRSSNAFKTSIAYTNENGETFVYNKESFGFFYTDNGFKKFMPDFVKQRLNQALENLK